MVSPGRVAGLPPGAPAAEREAALVAALHGFGAGTAAIDGQARLVAADPQFLKVHGVATDQGMPEGLSAKPVWPTGLVRLGSSLSATDLDAVGTGWQSLLAARPSTGAARSMVRLSGGPVLEMAISPCGPDLAVLAARIGASVADRLVHDVNNALGGVLAHLYLAMSDLPEEHPARGWVEAVNQAVIELHARIRRAAPESRDRA